MGNPQAHQPRNYRTKVVPVSSGQDTVSMGSVELGYQFFNHIHRPVTVLTRTGMRVVIPYRPQKRAPKPAKKNPAPLINEPCFIVRVKLITTVDVILDTSELSNDLGQETSAEAKAYLDAVQISEDKIAPRGGFNAHWVEYHIPQSDFDAEGGVLFLQNLDFSISILDQASTAPHPFSILGQRNRDAYNFKDEMAPKGLFYGAYIRDKDGQFGNRFININGTVHGVSIITEETGERDGVYFITSKRTTSSFVPQRTLVEYYPLEEANEKIGLYLTYNDALTLGNPSDVYKRELEERARFLKSEEMRFKEERAQMEHETEKQRELYKRAMMAYENELRRIDALNRLINAEMDTREKNYRREMMILKEILDARGHDRREAGEIIKLIPTVITTIAMYVAAYKKIKTL
jgi:hypothetical protein